MLTFSYFRAHSVVPYLLHVLSISVRLESISELTKENEHPTVQETNDIKVYLLQNYFILMYSSHWLIADLCLGVLRFVFVQKRCRYDNRPNIPSNINAHQMHAAACYDSVYKARLMRQ